MGGGDNWWTMASGAQSADVNMSLIANASEESLDSALEIISRVGVPSLALLAGPGLGHAARLPERGFAFAGTMPLMAISLEAAQPRSTKSDGFEFRKAYAKQDTDAVINLLHESFETPPEACAFIVSPEIAKSPGIYFWLLLDQGQPVCTVTTTTEEGLLGIWSMATPPRAQRKGYGHALLSHVMQEHAQQGQRVGLLGASPAGEPLYRRIGYEVIEHWQVFASGVSSQIH
ncbi:MAG TPA: GNAT family N-acetyltransferase [Candidatus Nanopelagicaceae bacterium]|nr:GNAT family N-acetyltransferase [Candidatus Nanopelagicaceae bacterium]